MDVATPTPGAADGGAETLGAWPFDDSDDLASAGAGHEEDADEGAPLGTGESEIEIAPRVERDDSGIVLVEPCSLVTIEEWAGIRGTDAEDISQVILEDGDACGFKDGEDLVRVAWAPFAIPGNGGWLPSDLSVQYVGVEGALYAQWVEHYPLDVSSVLEVWRRGEMPRGGQGYLVVEVSARDDTPQSELQRLAVELAETALPRWSA